MRSLVLSLFVLSLAYAEDMRQFLPETVDEKTHLQEILLDHSIEADPYIQDSSPIISPLSQASSEKSPAVMGTVPEQNLNKPLTKTESIKSFNAPVMGSTDSNANYLEFKNEDLIKEMKHKGESNFSFTIFKDTFTYRSQDQNFDKVFRSDSSDQLRINDNKKSVIEAPLMLRLAGHHYFYKNIVSFGGGFGIAGGYNGGRGYFSDGSMSQTNFKLWTVPVDLSLLAELDMNFLSLSVFGGPSAIMLIQDRDDLASGNPRKNYRQASLGYFGGAKLNFAISQLFPKSSYEFFGSYQITRYYLSLEARTQHYSDFKTPGMSVSGESYGAGFTFEYF